MSEELKPCPFCGEEATLYTPEKLKIFDDYKEKSDRYIIACSSGGCFCRAESLALLKGCEDWNEDVKQELIEMWQKRV